MQLPWVIHPCITGILALNLAESGVVNDVYSYILFHPMQPGRYIYMLLDSQLENMQKRAVSVAIPRRLFCTMNA